MEKHKDRRVIQISTEQKEAFIRGLRLKRRSILQKHSRRLVPEKCCACPHFRKCEPSAVTTTTLNSNNAAPTQVHASLFGDRAFIGQNSCPFS